MTAFGGKVNKVYSLTILLHIQQVTQLESWCEVTTNQPYCSSLRDFIIPSSHV